jgi:hypothetical protein
MGAMTEHDIRWLWDRWMDLWNGDLDQASEIIHPEFTLHRVPPPRIQARGREGLLEWVQQTRTDTSGVGESESQPQ